MIVGGIQFIDSADCRLFSGDWFAFLLELKLFNPPLTCWFYTYR